MSYSMDGLWQNMKHEVSRCPAWQSKAILVYEACKPDHRSDEALVTYTAEVHKKNESQ